MKTQDPRGGTVLALHLLDHPRERDPGERTTVAGGAAARAAGGPMDGMERIRLAVAAAGMAACLAAAGCDETLSSLAGPTPTLEPTFSSISREIFSSTDAAGRRACVSCHTNVGRSPAGGLNLLPDAAYRALVNVPSLTNPGGIRVIPGDPANSILVRKLEGAPGTLGARMPLGGPPFLTEGQIEIIRRWIENGAREN